MNNDQPSTEHTISLPFDETLWFECETPDRELTRPPNLETNAAIDPSLQCLLDSPLKAVSRSGLERLAAKLRMVEFAAGDHLLSQGQVTPDLFFIVQGRVRIGLTHSGTQIEIDRSESGEVVGEMSFVTNSACTADVVAEKKVVAYALSRTEFHALKTDFPELEIALANIASHRLGSKEMDALTGKSFGEYRFARCINRGGMGVVYEARDASGKQVAIKMLQHKFVRESEVIEAFIEEGRLLSSLTHPHIVSVRECFVAYNTRFMVMDYWEGADLASELLERSKRAETGGLGESTCHEVLRQVAQALDFAHSHNTLHLDIKPANILASSDGNYALSDFGLSRIVECSEAEPSIFGTMPYMPPEQFRFGPLTPAADYYALACTIAELLLGQRLFPQTSFSEIKAAKAQHPDAFLPRLPCGSKLAHFVRTGLAACPEDRKIDLRKLAS